MDPITYRSIPVFLPSALSVTLALCFMAADVARADPKPGQVLYNGIQLPTPWSPQPKTLSYEPMPLPWLTAPPAVIPIDVGRQLFVDDFLIEKTTLHRTFHSPKYSETPVLVPDKPWELTGKNPTAMVFSDGVFFDPKDRLFKMWYMGGYGASTCYATSTDGIHWEKPSLDVVPGTNIVRKEYCSGRAGIPGTAQSGVSTTALATLRRDGFASMDTAVGEGSSHGELTTRPVKFNGKHLFVNADTGDGELRAEILDEKGEVIAPFSADHCVPVRGSKTLLGVAWAGHEDLSRLAGRTVKFRFRLTGKSGAHFYAFWVSLDVSGASHGYVAAGGPGFEGPTDTVGNGAGAR
jgi:hypothetical protein